MIFLHVLSSLMVSVFCFAITCDVGSPYLLAQDPGDPNQKPREHLVVEPNKVDIDGFRFQVHPDFKWEKVASQDLTRWPIVATWHHDGSLIVAESAGVKSSVQEQLATRPHRIVRLSDSDHDGVLDTRTVVAEDMPFPEGVLVYKNHLLVAAPPEILILSDTNLDGVYDSRSVWHDGKTLTHCANDLHGPFWGLDGWIYWSKSAFAQQDFPISNRIHGASSASHLYRKRFGTPYDTTLPNIPERLMTGGMDNLVDVAFDESGDRFFVSTFLHHPGAGVRDGIGHAVYGAVFGKDHAVLQNHPRTGSLFVPIAELGPAAPAGMEIVDSHALIAEFNLQRISSHQLIPNGAGFTTQRQDLVIGEQLDFHPVDILQDINGSFLVVDTGGWYDLCCPSSGNEKRISTGGIYRLTPKSAPSYASLYDSVIETLQHTPAKCLTHANRRVRQWADAILFSKFSNDPQISDQVHSLWNSADLTDASRLSVFWSLTKFIALSDQAAPSITPDFVLQALHSTQPSLQYAALHTISLYKWSDCQSQLISLLKESNDPTIVRLAAEALGRIGDASVLETLLDSWIREHTIPQRLQTTELESEHADTPHIDRVLDHALLYAMMEISSDQNAASAAVPFLVQQLPTPQQLSEASEVSGISTSSVAVKQAANALRSIAALRVLKEILPLDVTVLPSLIAATHSPHQELARLACEAIAQSSELTTAYFALPDILERRDQSPALQIATIAYKHPAVIEWVAKVSADISVPQRMKLQLLESLAPKYANQTLPKSWSDGVAALLQEQVSRRQSSLSQTSASVANEGADSETELVRLLQLLDQTTINSESEKLLNVLKDIAKWDLDSPEPKLSAAGLYAISLLPKGSVAIPSAVQIQVAAVVLHRQPGLQDARSVALKSLKKIDWDSDSLHGWLEHLSEIGTLEFTLVLDSLMGSQVARNPEMSALLMQTLLKVPAVKTVPESDWKRLIKSQPESTHPQWEDFVRELHQLDSESSTKIEALLASLPPGDAYRGQDLFRSQRAACIQCHKIAYVGGTIGPELTRIGQSRNRRDFLEAILFPSQRIEQGYQATSILTENDETIQGLVALEDAYRIELIVNANQRVSIDKSEITERKTSSTSIMPAGIENVLSLSELADLIAFLEQCR
jgi:putative heme-binding domain-containing protein